MPNPIDRPNEDQSVGPTNPEPAADPYDLTAARGPRNPHINVTQELTNVSVHKPFKDQFFRVRPGDEHSIDWPMIEHGAEGSDRVSYWVVPDLWDVLLEEEHADWYRIFTCMSRAGSLFLWATKLAREDGNVTSQSWARSRLNAAEDAKNHWIKIKGSKADSAYLISIARGNLGDPAWPDKTLQELIKLAFSIENRTISSLDHPVIRDILGDL